MVDVEPESKWEDLGYIKDKPEKALFRIPPSPIPNHKHEPDEETLRRRRHALEFIFTLFPDAEFSEKGSMITVEMKGKRFDFWPSSDCWFSHSKGKAGMFGHGIQALCQKISDHLVNSN